MVKIISVQPGGIGEELELEPGDFILSINGIAARDLIDVELASRGEELLIEIQKGNGELWDLGVEKDAEASLGLEIEHPEPTQCGNNCLFCFVHQLPPGMRRTLYVKDEDYRFSYLYGSYVTLTNVSEEEIARIIEQKLSPLYVSVHASDEQLRSRLLGKRSAPILALLERLTAGGIAIHTQIVVCPGFNDGAELERTVNDLGRLSPGILSLAVVPVGLTGYRQRLPELRVPTPAEAQALIEQIEGWQSRYLAETGSRFVHAADEFYLRAGIDFPPLENYEDLPQLENGVGMIPLFREEAIDALAEARPLPTLSVSTVTGRSAFAEIELFVKALSVRTGARIHLHPIDNVFFGGQVTVTGLITGKDLLAQLPEHELGDVLLVPDVVLREGEDVLLDDVTLIDLARELKVEVRPVVSTPFGLLDALEELAASAEDNR